MPSKAFLKSRREGKKAQAYVAGMFRSWGLTVRETPDGYHPGFDMEVWGKLYGNEVRFKDEIKWDKKSSETGNLCIDINSLRKSQAGILTICTGDPIDTVYMLPLQDALTFAISYPIKKAVGEFGEASALIPIPTFISLLNPKVLTARS